MVLNILYQLNTEQEGQGNKKMNNKKNKFRKVLFNTQKDPNSINLYKIILKFKIQFQIL